MPCEPLGPGDPSTSPFAFFPRLWAAALHLTADSKVGVDQPCITLSSLQMTCADIVDTWVESMESGAVPVAWSLMTLIKFPKCSIQCHVANGLLHVCSAYLDIEIWKSTSLREKTTPGG